MIPLLNNEVRFI